MNGYNQDICVCTCYAAHQMQDTDWAVAGSADPQSSGSVMG